MDSTLVWSADWCIIMNKDTNGNDDLEQWVLIAC